MPLEQTFLIAAIILVITALIAVYRAIKGPTLPDRLVAIQVIGTATLIVLVLIAFITHQPLFIDVALTYALLNFLLAVIAGRYMITGEIFR
ncbi:monovalent cation/H+ antiporter complex subunit F [Methanonatronarchaeum sp. AMET6-2]|uniref:monovalent cation/H+ antiporter complex subunit F n=1 Tax=Methanonatronarchaeum sp. AMET6-2 TaxID=2933293 RepID=UPI00122663C1|nr:monovalent cation/H+ antiporter complex subunit F [Methanonatronarchaeum sp. AMET6-2]RZN62246.1 MAG: cation:proton antiporter [Methanonatronarchaeia archaeon]UOY10418.1 monovalent cation/H+ antiporter complex subunit F [Methanonatronarchaeum sp. AMET6-2]